MLCTICDKLLSYQPVGSWPKDRHALHSVALSGKRQQRPGAACSPHEPLCKPPAVLQCCMGSSITRSCSYSSRSTFTPTRHGYLRHTSTLVASVVWRTKGGWGCLRDPHALPAPSRLRHSRLPERWLRHVCNHALGCPNQVTKPKAVDIPNVATATPPSNAR